MNKKKSIMYYETNGRIGNEYIPTFVNGYMAKWKLIIIDGNMVKATAIDWNIELDMKKVERSFHNLSLLLA